MEKSNGGGLRLPVGYRFHPTDEELIVHYLRRKISGIPLPASVIPEVDVFQRDPWTLPGDVKERRYFFGRKLVANKCNIAGGSGHWKPIGKTRPILTSLNHIVGLKKTLIFNNSDGCASQWVMQEYRLLHSATKPKLGEWVVYKVFQRIPKKIEKINSNPKALNWNANCQFSSPCSSGVTEVHSIELDQEEITFNY